MRVFYCIYFMHIMYYFSILELQPFIYFYTNLCGYIFFSFVSINLLIFLFLFIKIKFKIDVVEATKKKKLFYKWKRN